MDIPRGFTNLGSSTALSTSPEYTNTRMSSSITNSGDVGKMAAAAAMSVFNVMHRDCAQPITWPEERHSPKCARCLDYAVGDTGICCCDDLSVDAAAFIEKYAREITSEGLRLVDLSLCWETNSGDLLLLAKNITDSNRKIQAHIRAIRLVSMVAAGRVNLSRVNLPKSIAP